MSTERTLDGPPCHCGTSQWAHPPPRSLCPTHLLSAHAGDSCQAHLALVSAGSKNPKIALKLAEFQTDGQGKVCVAGTPGEASRCQEEGPGCVWETVGWHQQAARPLPRDR